MMRIMFRTLKIVGIAISTVLVLLLIYIGSLAYSGNQATVVAGELYRSAQPNEQMLSEYVSEFGIKTVLNLRGHQKPGTDWYEEEISASQKLGLTHIDYKMSASHRLSKDQVRDLAEIMQRAEKPILVHCMSGSDRTGLASAIYLFLVAGAGDVEAGSQLSLRYGHFSVPYLSDAWPMDETWMDVKSWFATDRKNL